jgi:hypothetical protein
VRKAAPHCLSAQRGFALPSMAAADRSDNFAARLELEHEPTSTILGMVQREGSGFTLVVGERPSNPQEFLVFCFSSGPGTINPWLASNSSASTT